MRASPAWFAGTSPAGRPQRAAYAAMVGVITLCLIASTLPSPLYRTYQDLWSLSPVVLTLVYATYALAVLVTLLLAGPVSDHVGRRPILLVAVSSLMAALVLFMFARSVEWLFAARALQGVATGLAVSTASAALLDLHPRRDANAVGLHNGTASNIGGALGALLAATALEILPAPRVVPYAITCALFAVVLAAIAQMGEPVPYPVGLRLRPQRPAIPVEVRPAFLLAALGATASWSIAGISLALGPDLVRMLFHSNNAFVDSLSIVILNCAAVVSQLSFRRTAPWASAAAGAVALAFGLMGIVAGAAVGSGLLTLTATALTGLGFGGAYLGGLRALSQAIPADQRSRVMAAFYLVAYGSLSLPAILAGIMTTQLGLTDTFEILGTIFAVAAVAVGVVAWQIRPRPVAAGARGGHTGAALSFEGVGLGEAPPSNPD